MDMNKKDLIKTIKHEYDGKVGLFWQFLMGRHIHTGGVYSSQDLAVKAGLTPNMVGLELCCNNGESCRFLVKHCGVTHMTGVDLSPVAIERGRKICVEKGFMDDTKGDEEEAFGRIRFINADITEGLPMFNDGSFDFVWSEDSWCYIPDKGDLIKNCVRLLKPGGTLCFTDWCLGPKHKEMTKEELNSFLTLMTFPNLGSVESYSQNMKDAGLEIVYAHDTGRWLPCHQVYVAMLEKQFKADVLDLFDDDMNEWDKIMKDFYFMLKLAKEGKVCQGLYVGRKKGGKQGKL